MNKLKKTEHSLFSLKLIMYFSVYFILLTLNSQLFTITFLALGLYACKGKEQAIRALSLAVITKYLNPAIYVFSSETGILAWLIFFIGAFRLIGSSTKNFWKTIPLLLFSIYVVSVIMLVSKQPDVSTMKLTMFTLGVMGVVQSFSSLKPEQTTGLRIWFFSLIASVVILSLFTFGFHNIAYHRNGAGFQGIINHPQSFGPLLAPFLSWFLASMLFKQNTINALKMLISILLLVLILLTQARTSIAAVFLSLISTIFLLIVKYNFISSPLFPRTIKIMLFASIILPVGFYLSDDLQGQLHDFIYKRDSTDIEGALSSRSSGIASQWSYFLNSPWVGNGFGVYPWGSSKLGVIYYMGIPISAPVEKGFLPTAILEEVGILGTMLFINFIYYIAKQIIKNDNIEWSCVFFTCLFINVGEMVIFSMGGIGLFYWLLIGLSIAPSEKSLAESRPQLKKKLNSFKKSDVINKINLF